MRTFSPHYDRKTCPHTDTHRMQEHLYLASYAFADILAAVKEKRFQIHPNSAELIHNIRCQSKVIEHYKYIF